MEYIVEVGRVGGGEGFLVYNRGRGGVENGEYNLWG